MADWKLRIMYDYQMIVLQRFGGISRYIFDLATEFAKDHDVRIPVLYPKSYYFESYFEKKSSKFALWRWSKLIVLPLNKIYSIFKLLTFRPDILHLTYYNSYLLPFIPRKTKLVVTAHDMIHEIYPELFPKWDITTFHKRKVFERADLIIAISENTKLDLIKFFNVSENKITVIYHGNPFSTIYPEKDFKFDYNYYLFVGQRDRYKNFDTLVNAIAPILHDNKSKLLCVGGKNFNEDEKELFQTLKIDNDVMRIDCSDSELQSIYKKAICLIYPSTYEGFGIPILEAWTMECPVILSNSSCFPEIAKDGALYFEQKDVEQLRTLILKVTTDKSTREQLVEIGNKLLSNFTLKKTAYNTLNAYIQLLKK